MNWLQPNPFEDIESITVVGRRWRDSYGNTYHTSTVYLNGKEWKTSPITYGYGDHYLETAAKMLESAGKIPPRKRFASGGKESVWRHMQDLGIPFSYEATNVKRKRDL